MSTYPERVAAGAPRADNAKAAFYLVALALCLAVLGVALVGGLSS